MIVSLLSQTHYFGAEDSKEGQSWNFWLRCQEDNSLIIPTLLHSHGRRYGREANQIEKGQDCEAPGQEVKHCFPQMGRSENHQEEEVKFYMVPRKLKPLVQSAK